MQFVSMKDLYTIYRYILHMYIQIYIYTHLYTNKIDFTYKCFGNVPKWHRKYKIIDRFGQCERRTLNLGPEMCSDEINRRCTKTILLWQLSVLHHGGGYIHFGHSEVNKDVLKRIFSSSKICWSFLCRLLSSLIRVDRVIQLIFYWNVTLFFSIYISNFY